MQEIRLFHFKICLILIDFPCMAIHDFNKQGGITEMKKTVLALVTVFAMAMQLSAPAFAESPSTTAPETEKEGWELVFSDEFNGETINSEYWNTYDPNLSSEDYYFYANSPETIVCPENVSVSDGMLHIEAEYAPMEYGGQMHDYRTGTLQSRDKVELTYGLFEARIKMPDLPGSNPAFWLMPHHDGDYFSFIGLGGTGSEVDIVEHLYNDGDYYQTTVHWGGYEESHQSWTKTPKPYMGSMNDWHVFAVEWTPTELKFMVDDTVTGVYSGEAVPFGPEFIILSLGLGGWIGQPDQTRMPAEMLVDYVRVYQRPSVLQDGKYTITSVFSGKALDVQTESQGANVVQKTPNGSDSQIWNIARQSDSSYIITNEATGFSLDVYGQQTGNDVPIIQWSYEGRSNQRWLLESDNAGHFYIVNQNSKKVADVNARSTEEGAQIIQYEKLDADNQQWVFTSVTTTE